MKALPNLRSDSVRLLASSGWESNLRRWEQGGDGGKMKESTKKRGALGLFSGSRKTQKTQDKPS